MSFTRLFIVVAIASVVEPSLAQEPSPLGVYRAATTYCGLDPIRQDPAILPEIGCFVLSPGHVAKGTFSGHAVEVSVAPTGEETFNVDGTQIRSFFDQTKNPSVFTNLRFVRPAGGGSGYAVCLDDGRNCPSSINVFSRNADKTVLFTVSECLPPAYLACAISRENWNYLKSHPGHGR